MKKALIKTILFSGAVFFLMSLPLHAAEGTRQKIFWHFLAIGLMGGLAMFLYGMEKLSEGMKKTAGNQMRSILAALTKTVWSD